MKKKGNPEGTDLDLLFSFIQSNITNFLSSKLCETFLKLKKGSATLAFLSGKRKPDIIIKENNDETLLPKEEILLEWTRKLIEEPVSLEIFIPHKGKTLLFEYF